MTCPFEALRLKRGLPVVVSVRSKRASDWLFFRTDSMPFRQLVLAL